MTDRLCCGVEWPHEHVHCSRCGMKIPWSKESTGELLKKMLPAGESPKELICGLCCGRPREDRLPFTLSARTNANLGDDRFDWEVPPPPRCGQCKGRHDEETNCEEFKKDQVGRLKANDMAAYYWHAGYRRAKDPVYDTEAFSAGGEVPPLPLFNSFKPFTSSAPPSQVLRQADVLRGPGG